MPCPTHACPGIAASLFCLGDILLRKGDHPKAEEMLLESLEMRQLIYDKGDTKGDARYAKHVAGSPCSRPYSPAPPFSYPP